MTHNQLEENQTKSEPPGKKKKDVTQSDIFYVSATMNKPKVDFVKVKEQVAKDENRQCCGSDELG